MSELSQPQVIPAVTLVDRSDPPRRRPSSRTAVRRPLPLAKLSEKRAGSAVYGVSTLDASGRIADRAIVRALAWAAGFRLDIRESRGLAVVAADDNGLFRVTEQGYVHLPAVVRDAGVPVVPTPVGQAIKRGPEPVPEGDVRLDKQVATRDPEGAAACDHELHLSDGAATLLR